MYEAGGTVTLSPAQLALLTRQLATLLKAGELRTLTPFFPDLNLNRVSSDTVLAFGHYGSVATLKLYPTEAAIADDYGFTIDRALHDATTPANACSPTSTRCSLPALCIGGRCILHQTRPAGRQPPIRASACASLSASSTPGIGSPSR